MDIIDIIIILIHNKKNVSYIKKIVFFTLLVITVILVSYSSRGETSLEQSNIYALTNDTTVVTVPCVQAVSVCYFILKDTSGTEFLAETTGLRNVD